METQLKKNVNTGDVIALLWGPRFIIGEVRGPTDRAPDS